MGNVTYYARGVDESDPHSWTNRSGNFPIAITDSHYQSVEKTVRQAILNSGSYIDKLNNWQKDGNGNICLFFEKLKTEAAKDPFNIRAEHFIARFNNPRNAYHKIHIIAFEGERFLGGLFIDNPMGAYGVPQTELAIDALFITDISREDEICRHLFSEAMIHLKKTEPALGEFHKERVEKEIEDINKKLSSLNDTKNQTDQADIDSMSDIEHVEKDFKQMELQNTKIQDEIIQLNEKLQKLKQNLQKLKGLEVETFWFDHNFVSLPKTLSLEKTFYQTSHLNRKTIESYLNQENSNKRRKITE